MLDITMCKGKRCSETNTCYRYTAQPGMMQSYFTESPAKDGKCEYYWDKK